MILTIAGREVRGIQEQGQVGRGQQAQGGEQGRQPEEFAQDHGVQVHRRRADQVVGPVPEFGAQHPHGDQWGGQHGDHGGDAEQVQCQFLGQADHPLVGPQPAEVVDHLQKDPGEHHLAGPEQHPQERCDQAAAQFPTGDGDDHARSSAPIRSKKTRSRSLRSALSSRSPSPAATTCRARSSGP